MDGFKNTTRTQYDTASGRKFANGGMTVSRNDMADGQGPMSKPAMVAKYAKGGSVKKGEQKIGRVMKEFTEGKLHSGSKEGPKVKSTKQAVAIALNEARAAGAKIPRVKKAFGGEVDDVLMARMTKEELAQGAKGVKMAQERLERKSVKRGVPPANRKPMISERMEDVGRSIGVVKKAAGGLTLSNVPTRLTLSNAPSSAPTTTSNPADYSGPPAPVTRAKAAPVAVSPKPVGPYMNSAFTPPTAAAPSSGRTAPATAPAPSRGLTLSGPNVGRRLTLGMNKGGLSVMPRGKKGC